MNMVDYGDPLGLEALSKPNVDRPTIFQVNSVSTPCRIAKCCTRGRIIPCSRAIPHEHGIVIEKDGIFLLNGVNEIEPPVDEVTQVDLTRYALPCRKIRALSHPWGALIITEQTEDGVTLSLLVLPNH